MNNRDFKGIWIPKHIWLDKDLTLQEKVFLVEIDSLDNENGCFANNQYFSEFFGISKTRVSLVIKSLVEKGYILSSIKYKGGTKEILNRVLKVCYRPPLINVKDPTQQKLKDNNTINNTINNTNKASSNDEATSTDLFDEVIIPKNKKTLFKNSVFKDFEKFKIKFKDIEKIVDLEYYYDSIMDWNATKKVTRDEDGWAATARIWMRKDKESGKLKRIDQQETSLNDGMLDYLSEDY